MVSQFAWPGGGLNAKSLAGLFAAAPAVALATLALTAMRQANEYASLKAGSMHIEDLGEPWLRELEESALSDPELSGKQHRVIDVKGPTQARKEIEDGVHPARGQVRFAAEKPGRHRTRLEHNLARAFSL
jgi:hypothetical protein